MCGHPIDKSNEILGDFWWFLECLKKIEGNFVWNDKYWHFKVKYYKLGKIGIFLWILKYI